MTLPLGRVGKDVARPLTVAKMADAAPLPPSG